MSDLPDLQRASREGLRQERQRLQDENTRLRRERDELTAALETTLSRYSQTDTTATLAARAVLARVKGTP